MYTIAESLSYTSETNNTVCWLYFIHEISKYKKIHRKEGNICKSYLMDFYLEYTKNSQHLTKRQPNFSRQRIWIDISLIKIYKVQKAHKRCSMCIVNLKSLYIAGEDIK